MTSLSELSKPTACRNKHTGRTFNATENTEPQIYESLYSQEYVSALLAELEAKNKCIAEAEVRGVEKLAAAFKSWASDKTFTDFEAQRHWATASQEALSFAGDLRNGSCDDR
ncbi:hypothetical protein [Serratia nevei]|uniref:hypothetical protein n=1 Tax=Serratia nevei TaxID=2703794 RepID=UPI0011F11D58|nr:hypothetical protein [Serratia nevei]